MARARKRAGAARPTTRKAKVTTIVPTRAAGAKVPIVCSDCFEEFLVPVAETPERIVCPECRHVGLRSEDDFLAKAMTQKAEERKLFTLSLASGILFVLSLFIWGMQNSFAKEPDISPTTNYVFLGVSLLLLIGWISFAFKYERSRCDVYF